MKDILEKKQHFDVVVNLTSARDELYLTEQWDSAQGCSVQRLQIKAAGYQKINAKAGLMLLTPRGLEVDGVVQQNPHIIRDSGHSLVEAVVRKIAFGFAPNGQLSAIDQTVTINPKRMLASKILPLVERYPSLGRYTVLTNISASERKTGMFLPVIDTGISQLGLFLPDVTKPELQKFWREYIETITFADRTAQTICERNAIRKHPSVSLRSLPVERDADGNLVASVPVRAWKFSGDVQSELQRIAYEIEMGKRREDIDFIYEENDGIEEGVSND
jgi:hypothetical protein